MDSSDRVYAEFGPLKGEEAPCMWFARCDRPANGLRRGPVGGGEFGMVPICKRCDEKIERLSA